MPIPQTLVALIPARAGSERVPGKNMRLLRGHPLLAYRIAAAQESHLFSGIYVSTEDEEIGRCAKRYGAAWQPRAAAYATAGSPDIEWVTEALGIVPQADCFAILRPTSPFLGAEAIRAAWAQFRLSSWADSLRAVTRWEGPHPGKMWRPNGTRIDGMVPYVFGETPTGVPWHSCQTQALPMVYRQTAGLEIARTAMCLDTHTIAGVRVAAFVVMGPEALDINTEAEWLEAERLALSGEGTLPGMVPIRPQDGGR